MGGSRTRLLLIALAVAAPAAATCPLTPETPLSDVLVEWEIGRSHNNSLINRPTKLFKKYKKNIERYPRSGRFYHRKTELFRHIEVAFRIDATRIYGPEWISNATYEVYFEATEPKCDFRPMLRRLLVEQFKLVTRIEKRTGAVLVLTTPNGEPSLPRSKSTVCRRVKSASYHPSAMSGIGSTGDNLPQVEITGPESIGDGRAIFRRGCRVGDLANELKLVLGVTVVDLTTATGHYDFRVDFHRGMKLKTAARQFRKTFGAELAPSTGATEVLVVDSADRIRRVRWSR